MNNISLAKRITIIVLLAVVISTLALGVFSYAMERGEVIRAGAARALSVAQTVSSALDSEQYAEIMRTGQTNEYYDGYRSFLKEVLIKSGAVYLYVLDASYGAEVTYFAEGYSAGVSPDENEFMFGDTEAAEYYSDEMYETLETGLDTTTEVYNLGGYGKMVSGFAPVLDSSGNVLGVVGVDLPINETMAAANRFGVYMIVIAVCVCAAVSIITSVTVKKIFRHLNYMSSALNQIGSEGNLVFPPEVIQSARVSSAWENEIGVCARAFGSTVRRLSYLEGKLKEITEGNLSVDVEVLSEKDEIGIAIAGMIARLNEAFAGILSGVMRVSESSGQTSDGAKALASGAVRQAESIQELSGSISEVAERTRQNAEMAEKAARLADTIKDSAEKGGRQMDSMVTAVRDINQSGRDISKVIKVIDDIAFQTNILALNAAVEAARAGQHGKGFAVVAEEVRNLAAKSAEAANDTESLIVNSIEKAELGVRIAGETSASLSEIVAGINESNLLVSEIAGSSGEQARTIAQINIGVDQVAQVVQQNSAAARESAAASEEMNGQSEVLRELISQFRLKEGGAQQLRGLRAGHDDMSL